MANEKRQSTLNALNKFSQRQIDEATPREAKEPNKTPEKDVEKECVAWMRARGWSIEIYEAKATWSSNAGAWVQKGMRSGTCDCLGSTDEGISVAIEFKAKGKLSTFNREANYKQRKFIVDKISSNAFSVVVDSADRLSFIFTQWQKLREQDFKLAKAYLISMLPPMDIYKDEEKLFEDE